MIFTLIFALATAPAPAPLTAVPAAPTAPVTLEGCHMDYPTMYVGLLPVGKGIGPLHIDFRNDAKIQATEIRFDANLDGHDLIVVDKGSFASDIEIKHLFKDFSGGMHFVFSRQPQPTCTVLAATFADGTTWSAPVADAGVPQLFDQLAGSWKCTTAAGSSVTAQFTVAPSGEVDEHMAWTAAGTTAGGSWDQTFNYDAPSKTWNVKNTGSNGWVFTGTTSGADGNVVLITGTQNESGAKVATRERFTFELPKSFSHTWEKQDVDGSWKPTSYAECTLVPPAS